MRDERFIYICDNGEDVIYDLHHKGVILSKSDISDKLNDLYCENVDYHKKYVTLMEDCACDYRRISNLLDTVKTVLLNLKDLELHEVDYEINELIKDIDYELNTGEE